MNRNSYPQLSHAVESALALQMPFFPSTRGSEQSPELENAIVNIDFNG